MKLSTQIAKQLREIIDGKWIASTNLKTQLADVDWEMANRKFGDLNSIAQLTFHINYYIAGLVNVFEGGALEIRDKYSYDLPPIESQEDWEKLKNKCWSDVDKFSKFVANMSDDQLFSSFVKDEYGDYYRNIIGMVEHSYYHFGQIVIIKKILLANDKSNGHLV